MLQEILNEVRGILNQVGQTHLPMSYKFGGIIRVFLLLLSYLEEQDKKILELEERIVKGER